MWPIPQETPDLVVFTDEILYGKLHFLCRELGRKMIGSIKKVSASDKKWS